MAIQTKRMRICFENAVDFSADSPDELKNTNRGDFLTVNITDPYEAFVGTFAGKTFINFIMFNGHNFSKTSELRIQFFNDINQSGGVIYDTNFFPAWNFQGQGDFVNQPRQFSVFYIPALIEAKSYKVFIKDLAQSTVRLERLFIGEYFSPEFNPTYGLNLTFGDNSVLTRMESGSLFTENQTQFRRLNFSMPFTTLEDFEAFSSHLQQNGRKRDVFVSLFPEKWNIVERNYTLLGKVVNEPSAIHDFFENWVLGLEMEEL